MSFIDHRCECGHIAMWHRNHPGAPRCSNGACGCERGEFGPPELVETRDGWGSIVTDVTQPGEGWAYPGNKTCSCAECQAMYRKLAG